MYSIFGEWLKTNGYSGRSFARRACMSHITVYKAMKGLRVRKSTVRHILRFTGDELSLKDFVC